jgi:hypothetical protein
VAVRKDERRGSLLRTGKTIQRRGRRDGTE